MAVRVRIAAHLVVLAVAILAVAARPAGATAGSPAAAAEPRSAARTSQGAGAHHHGSRTHRATRHPRSGTRAHAKRSAHLVTAAARVPAHSAPTRVSASPARRHVHDRNAHRAATRRERVRATRHRSASPVPTGPTGWAALDTAIARIPSYRPGGARWVISGRYGHWGTADWYRDTLYVSPTVPTGYLYDVAVHEWSHELSVLDYDADVSAAVSAMNRYFGGSGLVGAERAADCMAILQGATWTHYTSCTSAQWRAGAAVLLRGGRV
jgi:hypothetical protein